MKKQFLIQLVDEIYSDDGSGDISWEYMIQVIEDGVPIETHEVFSEDSHEKRVLKQWIESPANKHGLR